MSRTGKIARLPQPLREELNHRLENGELARNLADWLNSLPEVIDLLATHFGNRPISEQNLSDWRNGGLVEWQLHRELLAGAADCAQSSADYAATGVSAKNFLAILNAHFAFSLQSWDGGPCGQHIQNLRMLKSLYATVLSLRRSEQHDERLALDYERLEFARKKESPQPPGQLEASPSASIPGPTETPSIQPPPDSLHQPPSVTLPTWEPHPARSIQTPRENSLAAVPSMPSTAASGQNPAPPTADARQWIAPSPELSKPAEPTPQHPVPQHSAAQQPAPEPPAIPSPAQPIIHVPTPAPSIPADYEWTYADWTAYDYPG